MTKSSTNTVEQIKASLKEAKDRQDQMILQVNSALAAMQQRMSRLEVDCGIRPPQGQLERPKRLDQLVQQVLPELSVEQILWVQQLMQALSAIEGQLTKQAALDVPTLKAVLATLERQVRRQLLALLDSKAIRDRLWTTGVTAIEQA